MKDKTSCDFIVSKLGKMVQMEIKKLCSDDISTMLLNARSVELTSFSWESLLSEARTIAPTLSCLLDFSTRKKTSRSNHTSNALIGFILSLLAKYNRPRVCLIQKIISIILNAGHTSKQVNLLSGDILYLYFNNPYVYMQSIDRLQKLMVCLSHKATIKAQDELGLQFDKDIIMWRDELVPIISEDCIITEVLLCWYLISNTFSFFGIGTTISSRHR